MATSATYNGITWTWTEDRTTGTYVNGDPYVVIGAGLTLTGTTPAMATGSNGIQINPTDFLNHGWDSRSSNYDASLRPTLPYSASAGDSIIKVRSMVSGDLTPYSGSQPVNTSPSNTYGSPSSTNVREAGVLTVVSAAPASSAFRPSPFGTTKTTHLVSEVNEALIPNGAGSSLTPIDPADITLDGRTLAILERRFARYQLDIQPFAAGRSTRPYYQMNNYDGFVARDIQEAIVMLSLDYPIASKRNLLYGVIQYGLDLYYLHKQSSVQCHGGRKLAMAFAAYMLENATMKSDIKSWCKDEATYGAGGRFYEDQRFQFSETANLCLWGNVPSDETDYWEKILTGLGPATESDPYGWIDGGPGIGESSPWYDQIHGMPKAMAHSVICRTLYPDLEEIWTTNTLSAGDRSEFGTWALPDPIELISDIADAGDEDGVGRFPSKHGTAELGSGNGAYRSQFIESVFTDQRTQEALMMPVVSPYNPAAVTPGSVEVTMQAFGYVAPSGWPSHRSSNTPPIPANGTWPYVTPDSIRYTLDGTEPNATSTLYSGAFTVDESDAVDGVVEVRAKAFKTGYLPSATQVSRIGVAGDQFVIVQNKSVTGAATGASVSLTLDATPTEGNMLVLASSWLDNDVAADFTVPAGWTVVMDAVPPTAAFNAGGVVAYKIAGASEPTTIEVTCDSSRRRTLGVLEISGIPDSSAVKATATNPSPDATPDASTSSGTTSSISAPFPAFAVAVFLGDTTSATPVTDAHAFSDDFEEVQSEGAYGTSSRAWHAIATKVVESAGSVDCTITPDQSCLVSGAMLVFEPADSIAPTVESATVNAAGNELAITFSEAMNTSNTTGFSLSGSGNNNQTYTLSNPVWSSGDTVLTFDIGTSTVFTEGFVDDEPVNSIKLSYTAGDVEDVAGNALPNLSNRTSGITNSSTQGTFTPTLQVQAEGTLRITHTLTGRLFGTISVDNDAITVTQDGVSRTIDSVSILGNGTSSCSITVTFTVPLYSHASSGSPSVQIDKAGIFDSLGNFNASVDTTIAEGDNSSTQLPGGGPSTKGNNGINTGIKIGV